MKRSSSIRATHVNTGTGIARSRLSSQSEGTRAFGHFKLRAEVESSESTALGGLSLAIGLAAKLGLPQVIDAHLDLLHSRRPYHESDHVLTHVYSLFVGGTAIEDIAELQHSEPVRRMLGTSRIPDPSTAGDFLRRFDAKSIKHFDRAIDEIHARAWKQHYGRNKQAWGIVDVDSHVHHVYGNQKEGADFTYKGGFGFHPLVLSLAQTQECLRMVNRPGNVASADGAAEALSEVAALLRARFERVLVRGDSAFARQDLFDTCEREGLYFAMVSAQHSNFEGLAEAVNEGEWTPFRARVDPRGSTRARRRRGKNVRRLRARQRGKRDLKLEKQWLTEIAYQPARSDKTYRLIIRRQRIEESIQGELFELWRYRFVLTDLPKTMSTEAVVRETYGRCDQENVIEQLQHGVAAMRMPTCGFLANYAHLLCARIAHNLKAWLAMLALPKETMRWEWKRFRKAFVYVAARVILSARQRIVRLADSHRFAPLMQRALLRLQI